MGDSLGFTASSELREDGKLVFCMLSEGDQLRLMVNQRAGSAGKPVGYEGIRLYWTPKDIRETRERLQGLGYRVSELEQRDYGRAEFFLPDDDGHSHSVGVPTSS